MKEAKFQQIIDDLKNNQQVELYLKSRFSDDQQVVLFFQHISQNTSLQSLDLSDNELGALAMEHLAKALLTNISLQSLDLSFNKLDAKAMALLAPALQANISLQSLDLSGNACDAAAMEHLAKALQTNTSLQSLNLSGNFLGAAVMAYLVPALQKNSSLQSLDLSNNGLDAAAMEHLAAALQTNTSLQSLNLSYNGLDAAAMAYLVPALQKNSSLQSLYLNGNKLNAEAMEHLATALQTNTSLQSLDLSDNHLDNEISKDFEVKFSQLLADNFKLRLDVLTLAILLAQSQRGEDNYFKQLPLELIYQIFNEVTKGILSPVNGLSNDDILTEKLTQKMPKLNIVAPRANLNYKTIPFKFVSQAQCLFFKLKPLEVPQSVSQKCTI